MAKARLVWAEEERFVGIDSADQRLLLSARDEPGGSGVQPKEALLLALAACISVSVLMIMSKKRQSLSALEVDVDGEQDVELPRGYRSIELRFRVRGPQINPRHLASAIELADHKYCPVSASLRPRVTITTSFEVHLEAGGRPGLRRSL